MVMQYTISACGLNEQDQATLMSFLKVLNLGGISLWDYSDEDAADAPSDEEDEVVTIGDLVEESVKEEHVFSHLPPCDVFLGDTSRPPPEGNSPLDSHCDSDLSG